MSWNVRDTLEPSSATRSPHGAEYVTPDGPFTYVKVVLLPTFNVSIGNTCWANASNASDKMVNKAPRAAKVLNGESQSESAGQVQCTHKPFVLHSSLGLPHESLAAPPKVSKSSKGLAGPLAPPSEGENLFHKLWFRVPVTATRSAA